MFGAGGHSEGQQDQASGPFPSSQGSGPGRALPVSGEERRGWLPQVS